MFGGIQQPRKHRVKGADTPELTREQKAKASEVQYDARYMDEDEVMKALLDMSPTCLEQLQAAKLNTYPNSNASNSNHDTLPSYPDDRNRDHKSDSMSESSGLNSKYACPETENDVPITDVAENLVGDVLDDCTDKLIDSKNKNNMLSSVYTFFATHNIIRRSLLRTTDWKIESCVDYLVDTLSRQKSLKGEQSIKTGTTAAKMILLLLWCMRKDFLVSSLSGTLLDSLVEACLSIIPQIPNSTKNRAVHTKPAAQLIWYCFAILGTLQLFHISAEFLPSGISVIADSLTGESEMEWMEFFRLHMDYLLNRKSAQKTAEVAGGGSLSWKTEEVLIIDGLFFLMAGMLVSNPTLLRAVRSNSRDRYSSIIWKAVRRLATLIDEGGGEDFINRYADDTEGLLSSASEICLGLPNLIGLCYDETRKTVVDETEDQQVTSMSEDDERMLGALSLFCRKGTHSATKHMTKNLSKDIVVLFREIQNMKRSNEIPKPMVIEVQRHDVLDCVSKAKPEMELEEVKSWTGTTITIEGWERGFVARCSRAFGGDHGVITTGCVFEDLNYTDALKFQEEERDRRYKTYDRALNKKYLKQSRQFYSDRKARLRLM